jgi:hypothetical protein
MTALRPTDCYTPLVSHLYADLFKSTELFFYILPAENSSTYVYKILSAVVCVVYIYEDCLENNLQWAVKKTCNEEKNLIIYKKYVHT